MRMLSTPRSRNLAEVSSAENPPPMNSTSTVSVIGSRSVQPSAYGSTA
jgi:hypothetical protein